MITEGCRAWLGQGARLPEAEDSDEVVGMEAKEVRVQLNMLRCGPASGLPPLFGRRRKARKRRHRCVSEPGELKKGRHCVQYDEEIHRMVTDLGP